MDPNPNPLFSGILWLIQILTAGVLLFHAYFNMLVDIRQKRRTPSISSDEKPSEEEQPAKPVHETSELPHPEQVRTFPESLERGVPGTTKAE